MNDYTAYLRNGGREVAHTPGNNFPHLAYFAVTWALRTCRASRGPVDVRYGLTFPRKLSSNLKNQLTSGFTRCLSERHLRNGGRDVAHTPGNNIVVML